MTFLICHRRRRTREEAAFYACRPVPVDWVDTSLVIAAIRTGRRLHLSFWDALIVQAALESGCRRLFTEDLRHGMLVDGVLRIENPFLTGPAPVGHRGEP